MPTDDDKTAAATGKAKDAGKAKSAAPGLRQLSRQELEVLRRQLQAKFHRK